MAGASAVRVTRATSAIRALDTRPVTVTGFCGVTQRGPFAPTLVTSYAEYVQLFGGPTLNSQAMDLSVKSFFDEGGRILWIARVVHCSDVADASTRASDIGTIDLVDRAGSPLDTLTIDGKTHGTYAASITITIAAPSNGVSTAFNLYVNVGGVITERFINLNLDDTSPSYVETVVNVGSGAQVASNLITVTDLASATASPNNLPALGTSSALSGGNDGLTSLADADFTGGTGANGSTGLRLLDEVEDLALIAVPGRATSSVANGVVTYCETTRGGLCFAVLDPPAAHTVAQMRSYVTSTASLTNLSEIAAIYYPRILVDNPNVTVFGNVTTVTAPPSGAVCGLYCRVDASKDGGAFEQPASIETGFLRSARGLEATTDVKDETKRGMLFDDRINPIMSKKGQPIYIDGARTLKATGSFPSVGESRGTLFLQQTIAEAIDPKRNQNNRPRLRNEIRMLVEGFLTRLTSKECFASRLDSEAWFFDIGDALNSPAEQAAGNVNARLGVALSKPSEFINIIIAPFGVASLNNELAAA